MKLLSYREAILYIACILLTIGIFSRFSYLQVVTEPETKIEFSLESGFYEIPQYLEIRTNKPGKLVRYTLDGTDPGEGSEIYISPIYIDKNTVVKAVPMEEESPNNIRSTTIFINESSTLPVVSLIIDPKELWDPETGIYVEGIRDPLDEGPFTPNHDKRGPEWARPATLEFFDKDKNVKFNIRGIVRIHGNLTRRFPQKSLRFCTNRKNEYINYKFFESSDVDRYKCILLRSSGNDWTETLFKDALVQELISETNLDRQNYQPSILFINGEYWGIHNIRDAYDEYYFHTKYNFDREEVVILLPDREQEGYPVVEEGLEGDEKHYTDMLDFIKNHDLTVEENFEEIKKMMDVDNFMDYQIVNIYSANDDWGDSNVRLWRYKNDTIDAYDRTIPYGLDGRWRWIVYDTDAAFGSSRGSSNDLRMFIDFSASRHSYWSSYLLRNLLSNEGYKEDFIRRYIYHVNYTYEPSRVINLIDQFEKGIEAEIPRHTEKWGGLLAARGRDWTSIKDIEEWRAQVQVLRDFATARPAHAIDHLVAQFRKPGKSYMKVNIPIDGGKVFVNGIPVRDNWSGVFVQDVEYPITIKPKFGYKLAGLEGNTSVDSRGGKIYIEKGVENAEISVYFEKSWIGRLISYFSGQNS